MSNNVCYKLIYFDKFGRDVRVLSHEWDIIKDSMPFQQLPVLEFDGKILFQSAAIEKYLAKQFGYMGENDFEDAQIDQILLSINDVMLNFNILVEAKNSTQKVWMTKELIKNSITPALKCFEKLLSENNSLHFVGNKITLADLAMFHFLWFCKNRISPSILNDFITIEQFYNMMIQDEKLMNYINTRRNHPF
ncbi:Hematopoietic prostaglandin D synthase [Strongyloides ratti]|uniref:Hematopoietic prostaglandin D synthase n=1 Tax=Strongyloides ratti TaxID=34506 RepID=A0A090LIE5_STRRB|nr:Hematopoietic prostaglandin D synthase [Strongyloides ratti]CEF69522.1 Hematopoietic prostaglandin D synthase [Strongyloides ratti]